MPCVRFFLIMVLGVGSWGDVYGFSKDSHFRFPWTLKEKYSSSSALAYEMLPDHYLGLFPRANKAKPHLSFFNIPLLHYGGEVFFQAPHRDGVSLVASSVERLQPLRFYPLSDDLAVVPWVSEYLVVVATRDGWVRGYGRVSGEMKWQRELSSYVVKNFIFEDGALFTQTASSQVVSLSLQEGKIKWVASLENPQELFRVDVRALSLSGGELWVGGGSHVEVFGRDSGEWLKAYKGSVPYDAAKIRGVVSPLLIKDPYVIFTRSDGEISAFLKQDATRPVWRSSLGVHVSSAQPVGDEIFYGTLDGQVVVWNMKLGQKTHSLPLSTSPITSITPLKEDVLLAVARDGELLGFHRQTKTPLFYKRSRSTFYAPAVYRPERSLVYLMSSYRNLYTYKLASKSF